MTAIRQAVILAGGKGTRLFPLTLTTPKPMLRIHKKPFLEHLIMLLKKNGIEEIILLTGYLSEQIVKYFGDGKKFGIKIKYSYSPIEYDTGSRIREARYLFDGMFLLLYCDNYWPLDLKNLMRFYKKMDTEAVVTVYTNFDEYTKNNIRVSKNGLIEIYDKTRRATNLNGVDIGFFIIKKTILNKLPKYNFHFEQFIFPKLIKKKQIAGFITHHKYYGLSTSERIPTIKKYLTPRKIIILDRDGVINKKPPKAEYVTTWRKFEWLPGSIDGLKLLSDNGYEIYIVTNQAGISRGLMTDKELKKLHTTFLNSCKRSKIRIKKIYYCPHGWEDNCFCRKPQPGMLYQAASDYVFDLTKALFIGDDKRDAQAGKAAGCKTLLLKPKENLYDIVKKHLVSN